ncbi:hypothetical protein SK128_018126 [Halocaridina rubra]|uniref:Uncharacterized protein n=1 Tax=Halocaridina rubra TaxID=373956 RepID=A0AAN8ZWB8_HALRR
MEKEKAWKGRQSVALTKAVAGSPARDGKRLVASERASACRSIIRSKDGCRRGSLERLSKFNDPKRLADEACSSKLRRKGRDERYQEATGEKRREENTEGEQGR